jgi:hypothetical protein
MTKYKLAQVMAKQEGYGIPGKIPTLYKNPLNLRHSPHSQHPHDPNGIGVIDTIEHGWEDADRQLEIWAAEGLTIQQMIEERQAPRGDGDNEPDIYLQHVCEWGGFEPGIPVAVALEVPAEVENVT